MKRQTPTGPGNWPPIFMGGEDTMLTGIFGTWYKLLIELGVLGGTVKPLAGSIVCYLATYLFLWENALCSCSSNDNSHKLLSVIAQRYSYIYNPYDLASNNANIKNIVAICFTLEGKTLHVLLWKKKLNVVLVLSLFSEPNFLAYVPLAYVTNL